MSLTESFTVAKPNVNLDPEVFSGTFFSQNTHKEGLSWGTRGTNLASDTEAENTATENISEHPSVFSAIDAAREKSSRKRRFEADSESEFSEKEDDEHADFKRFRAVPKNDEFKWDLPESLAKYANDHLSKFVPEKDLQESILVKNPVLLNLHPRRKMNEFLRDLIFEKRTGSIEVQADSNLVKLQQKLLDAMGPLSQVWTIVEKVSNPSFEEVEVSLPENLTNLDQTVMLLDQAFNNISYSRRFNALKQTTTDHRKTKQLLTKKKVRYLLQKHKFYAVKNLSLT